MKTQLEKLVRPFFSLFPLLLSPLLAQTVRLPEYTVTLSRDPLTPLIAEGGVHELPLTGSVSQRPTPPDFVLRGRPEFSLFRRGTSFDLNPTAQGVSLRGIGPSGASRSLVLWDGIPLNDGFGGWVNWTKVGTRSLAAIETAPSGAATSWGNAALSGALLLRPRTFAPGEGELFANGGSFDTWGVEGTLAFSAAGTVTVDGARSQRAGAIPVRADQRGAVDAPARLAYERVGAKWSHPSPHTGTWEVQARWYREDRGNGTVGQVNGTRERLGVLRWNAPATSVVGQTFQAYVQSQTYRSTFTTVAADRARETPASEQFSVPATAVGSSWTLHTRSTEGLRWQAGVDARQVTGETREAFAYSGGNYTRERRAGGRQSFAGAFLQLAQRVERWQLVGSLRGDLWRETRGHRRETDRATGQATRNETFAPRSGHELSPRVGVTADLGHGWSWSTEAYRRFRRPTLNELHRPFRQGSDQTEANPFLTTEHLVGAETGVRWRGAQVGVGVHVFTANLDDAVANVTVARGPGTYPDFGFIPAGGTGRRRLNLDRLRTRGLQSELTWDPRPGLHLRADWLFTDSDVVRASVAPSLVGRTPQQSPAHVVTAGLDWDWGRGWSIAAQTRWSSRQFEDDENRLLLPAALAADVSVSRRWSEHLSTTVGVRNVADAEVEISRNAAGIVQLGQPRDVWIATVWRL